MVDNRGVTVAAATRDRAGVLKSTVQLRGDAVRAPPTAGFRIDSNHLSDSRCPLQYLVGIDLELDARSRGILSS